MLFFVSVTAPLTSLLLLSPGLQIYLNLSDASDLSEVTPITEFAKSHHPHSGYLNFHTLL